MSRTDKTRPWWVKIGDQPMVTCHPHHDHRFGPCTLPDTVDAEIAARVHHDRPDHGCHWVVSAPFRDLMHNGCRDCTGYHYRRADRRRSRHESRRELDRYRGDE